MTGLPLGALDSALPLLRCPVCGDTLHRSGRVVACPAGHAFDVARQGYLNLAVGRRAGTADTGAMVSARDAFLARGHYQPIAEAVAAAIGHAQFVVDLAGGTGYYLGVALESTGGRGVCLDVSAPALRRAARAHPRGAAVGADAWQPLPLGDATVDALLSVFGPRDPAEIGRVVVPDGLFVTVAPTAGHLAELREPLALIGVDPHKDERSATAFARFERVDVAHVRRTIRLTRDDAYSVAAMGPSARHVPDAELRSRAAELERWTDVTLAVDVTSYRNPASY